MHTVTHTPGCYTAQTLILVIQLVFTRRYPNYCRTCDGWGTLPELYDPSPDGVSLSPGFCVMHAPCYACEGSCGIPTCSLCGQIMSSERYRLCTCPLNMGYPVTPPCECWEEEL